jgi:tol-pal system protein YbgF
MRSARTGCGAARRGDPRRFKNAAAALTAVLVIGMAGGCGLVGGGAKRTGEAKTPADPVAALRQDVDRLRTDLSELRTLVETAQRTGTEHAERAASETRAELEAVQKVLEASARHDLQRQVEVLDAQARRIDLLEKRAAEQGQALRRVELALTGIESQLARVLETPPAAPARGARAGSPARPPAATPARGEEPATPAESPSPSAAAGANLTPPAMLGLSRSAASPASARGGEATADSVGRPPAEKALQAAKPADAPGDTKAAPVVRKSPGDPARLARGAPAGPEAKAAPAERSPGAALPRPAKPGVPGAPPIGGSLTAHTLFDRAMENWRKGEMGQAVLDFEELVQTFPSDPLAGSAQFRIGEAYYAARDFERAALEYRRTIEIAPKGKDTPQALLRLGLAYRAQKRESDARQVWSQLVRDFPESDATEEARRVLRGR